MSSDPNIGRLLNKRYYLQELIGTGAMGRVYCANDVLLGGVPVAVKFLSLSPHNEKMRLQERFEREAKTCALLGQKSIHIVRVMDYGLDENDTPYYVMEYLQGNNLSTVIRKQNISLSRFLNISRQICMGLNCAHEGILLDGINCPIIHRDIKPSNMIAVQDPSFGELVKVLDFGIAKLLMLDNDQTKFYLGTLAYSSPEQMEGKELDQRSDIYSLGIMMFEMITGKMPLVASVQSFGAWYKTHHFQDPYSFAEVAPTLKAPKQLEDLIKSCLAKKPGERPQNIGEILKSLEAIENDGLRPPQINPPVNPDHIQELTVKREIAILNKTDFIGETSNDQTKKANFLVGNFISLPETRADLHSAAIPPDINQDNIAKFVSWPENKPIADIVFPQPFYHSGKVLPAIWVMLPYAEISKRLICTRYNQFLFIAVPHPMLLWITVIYNRKHGPKWFPYYLDLKTTFGQEIMRLLQQTGYYHILLFARETPSKCVHVLHSSIAPSQCERLKEWLQTSYISRGFIDPQVSKNLLKREYEKIKPKIVSKLENIDTDSAFDLSG